MEVLSFGLGEVSQHVLDSVQAYINELKPVTLTKNFIKMEVRNMGVITNKVFTVSDANFNEIMKIFMSEQPNSTG